MRKLSDTHMSQVNTMENARKSAITAAQSAYNQKDFAAAKEQMTIAKNLETDIYNHQKEYSTQALNYYKEVQTQNKDALAQTTKDAQTKQKNQQFAIKNGINKPFYTIDGTTLISTQTGQELKNMDEYKSLGGKGDGSDVQFTSSTPIKFETKNIIGDDGKTHSVHIGYNAQGHVVSEENLGVSKTQKGKGSPSASATVKEQHNLADQALSKYTGKALGDPKGDNHVSPDNFNKLSDAFVNGKYGTAKQFYSAHKNYANPKDVKAGRIKGA